MSTNTATKDFVVNRSDYSDVKWVDGPAPAAIDLATGQILVEIEKFAMTANNITYAVVGEMVGYWQFFPADDDGWGRVPSWGFAKVVRSEHEDFPEGERIFGFLPMSTHLRMQPEHVSPNGFQDLYEHRRELHQIYNSYTRVENDPSFAAKYEDLHPVLRPLFTTAFLIDDFFADSDFFGAQQAILLSASSKTSIGTAFCLSLRADKSMTVIGATSEGNKAFVESLGCYDRVVTYDELASLPTDAPTAIIDYAGNGDLADALHNQFRDKLIYHCMVGKSHWDKPMAAHDLPGAEPAWFFAPDQLKKRSEEWGPEEFAKRHGASWDAFLAKADGWLTLRYHEGAPAVEHIYKEALAGRINPADANICTI